MTTYPWDLPGYAQHHVLRNDAEFYDSAETRWIDQAGYGEINDLEIIAGTPTFVTAGSAGREALRLDNTCHAWALPAIPWEGTVVLIGKPTLVSASVTLYSHLFGKVASVSTNGRITWVRASGNNTANCITTGSSLSRAEAVTSGALSVLAFELNQEERKIFSSLNGGAATGTSAASGTTNGNAVAIGHSNTTDPDSRYMRVGNTNGTFGDLTQNTTDFYDLSEQIFYQSRITQDFLTLLTALAVSKAIEYGT